MIKVQSPEMQEETSLIGQSCKFQFICNQCEKTFSESRNHTFKPLLFRSLNLFTACKQSLTNHLRIHSNVADAPYVCHVCFKRFFSNGSLRGHFLTHQNVSLNKLHRNRTQKIYYLLTDKKNKLFKMQWSTVPGLICGALMHQIV